MRYAEMLAELVARGHGRPRRGLSTGTTRALLAALGRPDLRATNVVVAGTNGKGSTSALIARALGEHGRRTGLFTSPHLISFTERIRIDGRQISPAETIALYREVVAAAERAGLDPSFFECATVMAALAFAEAGVDTAVWEVGLGGRRDATNAIAHQLSVITRIALDHQEQLGPTVAAIAREKAGIISPHQPVVLGPQAAASRARVRRVVAAAAARQGASLFEAREAEQLAAGLPPYQRANVGTAKKACELMGVAPRAFARAAARFAWPGRYQLLPGPLLLDGAHNLDGMVAFRDALSGDLRLRERPRACVFSTLARPDRAEMAAMVGNLGARVFVCPCSDARSLSKASLLRLLPAASGHDSPATALAEARRAVGQDGLVIVVGSLFLVGDVLTLLGRTKPDTLLDA